MFGSYGKEYDRILKLAFPIILSQVGQILVQLADNIMVGRLGAVPLAGVSFAGSVFYMVFILGMGISFGLTPLVGEMYVQSNYKKTASFLQNSLLLYTLAGIVLCALAMGIIPLMHYMGQPPEVVEVAIPYYRYLAWSLLPFMVFAAFKQFLEGVGNTKVAMVIIIVSNAVNILFNWLLIYGKGGFPAMGTEGAGISTLIARLSTFTLIIFYFYKRDSFRRYIKFFKFGNFSWAYVRSLFKVGSPIAMQMFMEGGAFAIVGIMMGWIGSGAVVLAGNQIATVISNLAFMILVGISSAATICVSHAYGRRDVAQIKRYAGGAYRLGLMWNIITALAFISLRRYIPMLFTSDPEVIDMAARLLVFVAIFQVSDGLQINSVAILRGVQDVKSIMWVAFFSYIVVCLPAGYFLAFIAGLGPGGLWIGLIIGLSLAAILLNIRYRKVMKRQREYFL